MPGKHACGAKLGDVALVLNTVTGDNCYAIYGDVGPQSKIGEISIRLATALGIDNNPKKGGTATKTIAYLVFPGSVASWKQPKVWWDVAHTLVNAWGGLSRLKEIAKTL